MLLHSRRSLLIIDALASAFGSGGISGELETAPVLCWVFRVAGESNCECGGRYVRIGLRWRSLAILFCGLVSLKYYCEFAKEKIPKTFVSGRGRDAWVVPNAFVTSCSR
jgi:hypothetical protein